MAASKFSEEAARHLALVTADGHSPGAGKHHLDEELSTAPLFSSIARQIIETQHQKDRNNRNNKAPSRPSPSIYPQYGLLGLRIRDNTPTADKSQAQNKSAERDPNQLVYTNVAAPWSAFICGSQGSGKSHTLSCLLENSLIAPSSVGVLASPLAGLVLHYDKFTAFSSTQLCEAAYLCSSGIPVRVLVSPTNYMAMKKAYESLPGLANSELLSVTPMYLSQRHLNISMMKTLMGVGTGEAQPLYVEVIVKILREMATRFQGQVGFDYNLFKRELEKEQFVGSQNLPLKMRLEVLESFFEPGTIRGRYTKVPSKPAFEDMWTFTKGTLTIIDLSCPFVGPDDACVLFNICVSLFLKGRADAGRVIALDEAHKFLTTTSTEAMEFTGTLLSVIRQQRHLGARVVIATQEPTISPSLLDLCNVTIVHRFTSPAWYSAIERHIAGAATTKDKKKSRDGDLFRRIVRLATGEAFVFCPTALIDLAPKAAANGGYHDANSEPNEDSDSTGNGVPLRKMAHDAGSGRGLGDFVIGLGSGYMRVRIRKRVTADGGRSQLQQ